MSAEENKDIVRQWLEEVWNNGQLDRVEHYYAPTYTINGVPQSLDQIKEGIASMRSDLDAHITIDDIIAEGDTVAYRYTWRGTVREPITQTPFGPIGAAGKPFTSTAMTFLRLADGKIVEDWFNADFIGLYQQLGVIPNPEQPQPTGA